MSHLPAPMVPTCSLQCSRVTGVDTNEITASLVPLHAASVMLDALHGKKNHSGCLKEWQGYKGYLDICNSHIRCHAKLQSHLSFQCGKLAIEHSTRCQPQVSLGPSINVEAHAAL